MRPFLNTLERNFQKLYSPNQCLSIYEDKIAYKGRFSFKHYLPSKPTKYGIKFFAICDSVTGYCMRFEIYTGGDAMLSGREGFTFNINCIYILYTLYIHCIYNVYTLYIMIMGTFNYFIILLIILLSYYHNSIYTSMLI